MFIYRFQYFLIYLYRILPAQFLNPFSLQRLLIIRKNLRADIVYFLWCLEFLAENGINREILEGLYLCAGLEHPIVDQ